MLCRSCSSRVQTWRRQPTSHSCSSLNSGQVVACPLCATTDAVWSMTWRSLSTVVDVPVIMQRRFVSTVEVPQIQFIAGVGGHSSSQQRWALGFHSGGYDGDEGFFGLFRPFFALLRVVPDLSASFRTPRWRRVLCHPGLLHNFMLQSLLT